jgi:hypothetical protein
MKLSLGRRQLFLLLLGLQIKYSIIKPMVSKFFRILLTLFFIYSGLINAQTGTSDDITDSLRVYAGSGSNQVLVPVPDSLQEQNLQIGITSSDTSMLVVTGTTYTPGNTFAVVQTEEKGKPGTVDITILFSYEEGVDSTLMSIHILPYNNPGMLFEIHDIVFWQEAIPLTGEPVYQKIIQTSAGPYNQLNYDEIPLTVNMDCTNPAVCTGHDFYTSYYEGYIVPPADGTYHFYMRSANNHTFWLSQDHRFENAQKLVSRSDKYGKTGTELANGITQSAPVQLKGGKVYAFYATQWIIHSTLGGILWDGPGINMSYIKGANTMPIYDVTKPSAPGNLTAELVTSSTASVKWDQSSDNAKVAGYNIYINGMSRNRELITGTSFLIDSLAEETTWQIVVTAVDHAGNESLISSILEVKTLGQDDQPPMPPQQLEVIEANGLALHLTWSGASDNETSVIGYNLYVDGILYNTDGYHLSNDIIIKNLLPETEYQITLEAVDGGLNVSEKSEEFPVSTVAFDATGPSLGEKMGKVIVHNQNTSWNEGFGINGPYENGDMVNNGTIRQLVRDFHAGAIRWGAIPANSKSLQGSTGTGKVNTYGKMLAFANEIDARFALTVGVKNGIDYRTTPATFLNLLEYLAGDESTTWGAIRASEGYTEPLLQKSKGILLEFGNEVWGAAAHDAEIGSDYSAYAKWVREMTEVVKSSPYYDPEKIMMVYSGRYPHPDYSYGVNTKVLTGDRGHAESLGVSGYLGGNLSYDPEIPKGDSELQYYQNGIDMARRNMEGLVLTMKEMLSLTGTLKTFYLYESNMTTSSYNGRFGQALVMTDYLASTMNYGSVVPSIFHLTGGEWRITQPANNYRKLPLYFMGQYFNRFCKGHILKTSFISNEKITNASGKVINYNAVGAFSYNSAENFSVMLTNRDFENDFTVQLELPSELTFAEEATIYTISEENFSSYNTNIDSVTVALSADMLVKIPRHGMVIISFTGEDPGYTPLPLGHFERIRPDSLKVTSSMNFNMTTNQAIDIIRTEVLPSDAFSTSAIIEVIENTTKSTLTPLSGGRLRIQASGVCGDEGYIKIFAYAADNPELNDTVVVTVSNQGTGCPVTSAELTESGNEIIFYPNPATDKIYIHTGIDSRSQLQITDANGKVVYRDSLKEGYEIPVKEFRAGLYILWILKPEGTLITGKFQKQ